MDQSSVDAATGRNSRQLRSSPKCYVSSTLYTGWPKKLATTKW